MAHQTDTPQFYPLTVRNVTIRSYRLVCEVVTPMKVSFALHHQLSIKFAGDNRRTGSALEFSKPTAVVEMSVTVQQDLHILQLETKLLDIGFDLWQTLNVTRVQKNVALRGDNQKRTDQIGADVIDVSYNSSRFKGQGPILKRIFDCFRPCISVVRRKYLVHDFPLILNPQQG